MTNIFELHNLYFNILLVMKHTEGCKNWSNKRLTLSFGQFWHPEVCYALRKYLNAHYLTVLLYNQLSWWKGIAVSHLLFPWHYYHGKSYYVLNVSLFCMAMHFCFIKLRITIKYHTHRHLFINVRGNYSTYVIFGHWFLIE